MKNGAPVGAPALSRNASARPRLRFDDASCSMGGDALSRHDRRAHRYPSVATKPTIRRQPLGHWT